MARIRPQLSREMTQQRGLAGAGRPHHRGDAAARHVEIEPIENRLRADARAQTAHLYQRVFRRVLVGGSDVHANQRRNPGERQVPSSPLTRTAFAGLQTRTPKAARRASAMDGASLSKGLAFDGCPTSADMTPR